MKILLALPPMSQLNSPYPSTAYLKNHLQKCGHIVKQSDWSILLANKLFSRNGITTVFEQMKSVKKCNNDVLEYFLSAKDDYISTVDSIIDFLQGNNHALALRIANRTFIPEGPRFSHLDTNPDIIKMFGKIGTHDKAKFLSSLYIDDLSDLIKHTIDENFELSKYGEKLALSCNSFESIYESLSFLNSNNSNNTLIDQIIHDIVVQDVKSFTPDLVGISIPFPGNLIAGLKAAKIIKTQFPNIKIAFGGGFVNTELRSMSDIRPFEFFDFLLFDDGELPLQNLANYLENASSNNLTNSLVRTWFLEKGKIQKINMDNSEKHTLPFKQNTGPTYTDLPLDKYISLFEMPNIMHKLWSDYKWNKMMLAHGCYWKQCFFCDTTLDYINRFEPHEAKRLVDQMERIIKETNNIAFHFVDEAAPPALLKEISLEIIKRKLKIVWWGNVRFDRKFDKELVELMSEAGCVAVTGGLEVASSRILKLINKGVTIEQVREVTKNFSKTNILVHAYLMYGIPTQTLEETIESLENVRQLFLHDSIQSAFWHKYSCTKHSPSGCTPEKFSIKTHSLRSTDNIFAVNDLPFEEIFSKDNHRLPVNHDELGNILKHATYNYMHGICLDIPAHEWFSNKSKINKSKNKGKK